MHSPTDLDCCSGEILFDLTKSGQVHPAVCNPITEDGTRNQGFGKHCFKSIYSWFKCRHLALVVVQLKNLTEAINVARRQEIASKA